MIHTIGNNGFIGVEVPKKARNINIMKKGGGLGVCLSYRIYSLVKSIFLPDTYTFCFLYPSGVSEEWAKEIVETEEWENVSSAFAAYRNYITQQPVTTSLESLSTLMQSLGLNNKHLAICQKLKD